MAATSGRRSALRIAVIYAVFGVAWIFLSDSALSLFSTDPAVMTQIAIYKGWLYVLVTAFLLYSLLRVEFHFRRVAEAANRLSEAKFRLMAEATSAAMIILDDGNLLFANEGAERLTGYSKEELFTTPLADILLPEYRESTKTLWKEQNYHEDPKHLEAQIRIKSGEIRWIDVSVIAVPMDGRKTILGTAFDISRQKNDRETIRISLHEKEILLKEIHHRVKNNMQVISSLLRLQSDFVKDDFHRELFQESQGRVKSMALIHEKLYRSENLASIDFDEYVRELTDSMIHSYHAGNVTLTIPPHGCRLGIDSAIPCGLIVHELVSNSLKHAFPHNEAGEITVSLETAEKGYILSVRDNGAGIPPSVDPFNTKTLGLQLVTTLAQQLNGTPVFACSSGTDFVLSFSETKASLTSESQ